MVLMKNKNKKTIYLNEKSLKILFIISKVRNNQAWFSKWINRKLIDEFNSIDMTNDYFKLCIAEFNSKEEELKTKYENDVKEIQRLRNETANKFNSKEQHEKAEVNTIKTFYGEKIGVVKK